jgi:hypothetical protein
VSPLGQYTGYPLGMFLGPAVSCARQPVLRILPPAIYVRTRLTRRLASVDVAAGEACFQKPSIKMFCTIVTLRTRLAPACSPTRRASSSCPLRWGSQAAYGQARRLRPRQVGVLGGIRPSAPVATPSSGSILSATSLKPFQRSHLDTFPKFLQRSQQLVWWKLPSSTCI